MIKTGFSVTEFTKSMFHSCIKAVRLKPDQPNQRLQACSYRYCHYALVYFVTTFTAACNGHHFDLHKFEIVNSGNLYYLYI